MNTPAVAQLVQTAAQLANAGRWNEAEQAWREVRRIDPNHPQALYSLGIHALQRGDAQGAHALLQQANSVAPRDPLILLTLAAARRDLQDLAGEREAIEATLALDPYYLPGLLSKGAWLERNGHPLGAAETYRNSLRVAPPEPHWPPALREQLAHAAEVVNRHAQTFHEHLRQRLADLQAQLPAKVAGRWREAASVMAGRSQPYRSECNQLYVPRLPAIPFFDPADFPWVPALQARTDAIRGELVTAMQQEGSKFVPYIGYRPGEPVNQWQELNHSMRWSTLHLWRGGIPVDENLARCPTTAAALREVEMADIGGLCPNAMFSVLAPRTRIPPHNGETNARVIVHLPLIVPEGCTYRVGFEETKWTVGDVLIFDDTLEHEARNDGDETRVVLIFDVWNPLLTAAERQMVSAMAAAAREFRG
jgi:aspartyl/asparaginyl beta-hydroxylase (cupin superfamily)